MTELEYLNVFLLYTDTETATPVCVLFKSSFNTILTTLQEIWGKCIYSMSFQGHFWIRKGLAPSNIIWILFDYFFSNKKGTFHPFHDVGGTSPPCPPCPPVPTPLEKMIEQNTSHHISLECQAAWHLLHQTPAGALR